MPVSMRLMKVSARPPLAIGPSSARRLLRAGQLAVLILPLCLFAPERSGAQNEDHPLPATPDESGSGSSDSIAWLTFCLVGLLAVSTAGLWFLTWRSNSRQASEMAKFRAIATDAASAGRNAARAANRAADTLVSIERAYLFIDEEVELDPVGDAAAPPTGEAASPDAPNHMIKFTFVNRGRTPAILESIGMGVLPSLEQPRKLDGAMLTLRASVPVGSVISPNSSYERRLGCPFHIEPAMLKQVEQGAARLYFLGRIGYKDIFGHSHETGFGLEFEPGSQRFMRVLSDELNYYT